METLIKFLPSLANSLPVVALAVFGLIVERFIQHLGDSSFTGWQKMILSVGVVVVILSFVFTVLRPLTSQTSRPSSAKKRDPKNPPSK